MRIPRRDFITLLGGAATWPLVARAQQPAMPAVGFLNQGEPVGDFATGFRTGLSEGSFVEGQNISIEFRWAEGHYDRLPELAAELVSRKVAVIVAAYHPAALAAKSATSTIPIVFISGLDPVTSGLVTSLNRPDRNLTGISNYNVTLVAKRLELMHEVVPEAGLIAMLVNPTTPVAQSLETEGNRAAQLLGLRQILLRASTASEIDAAFATLIHERAGALVVPGDAFFSSRLEQITTLTARYRIPTIYDRRENTVAGGMMSYGTNQVDMYRQAGVYAVKILKGAKPADLPVEQATKIELAVNLKSARALGIDMPTSVLLRADEVIE
jgi:putative ABC transport system substrate-binding protein